MFQPSEREFRGLIFRSTNPQLFVSIYRPAKLCSTVDPLMVMAIILCEAGQPLGTEADQLPSLPRPHTILLALALLSQ